MTRRSRSQKTVFTLLFSLSMVFFSNLEAAEILDFQSARSLSLAGGGRGGPLLTDTIQQNAAFMGFQQVQSVQGTYNWLNLTPTVPSVTQRVLNFSVMDGKNPYAQGGIALTRRPDFDIIHVAVARKITDWLSVGGIAKRFKARPAMEEISGDYTGYDGGVSLAIAPNPVGVAVPVQFGVSVDNLVRRSSDEARMGGRKVAVGMKANLKNILSVYGDFVETFGKNTPTYPHYSASAELSLGSEFYARGGLYGFKETGWGAGGGWMGPKIGINYGYQKKLTPRDGFEHALSIDIYM